MKTTVQVLALHRFIDPLQPVPGGHPCRVSIFTRTTSIIMI